MLSTSTPPSRDKTRRMHASGIGSAVSARHDKHYDVALDAMQKAKTLGASKGLPAFLADYELAATYAAMGDSDRALASLKSSADGGFSQSSPSCK